MIKKYSHPVSLIPQYRMPLMGLAAIWIVAYHSFSFGTSFLGSLLNFVKAGGFVGVDIFFFLSGMGLMMGWHKKRYTLKAFYLRRLSRILPAYWIVIVFGLAARFVLGAACPMGKFAADFFCVGYLIPGFSIFGLWFVDCIILFYLLFPLLAYFMTKPGKSFKCVVIVTCVSLALAIFLGWIEYGSYLNMFILRWPVFILGMYTGLCIVTQNYTYFDKVSSRMLCLILLTGIVFLFISRQILPLYVSRSTLWQTGIWFCPSVIIFFPFCYWSARLCDWCKKNFVAKKLITAFSFLGESSWEIYLVHVVALNLVRGRWNSYRQFHPEFFVAAAAIACAILLHYLLQNNRFSGLFKSVGANRA